MDLDIGVEGVEFAFVGGEELVAEVAEEDCTGAIVCELMGTGASNTEGGICAFAMEDPVRSGRIGKVGEC